MKKLEELVGEAVIIMSSFLDSHKGEIKLLAVEPFGVWIKADHLSQNANEIGKRLGAEGDWVFFVPFHKIDLIATMTDVRLTKDVPEGSATH